jgi:hypothetical protein
MLGQAGVNASNQDIILALLEFYKAIIISLKQQH